MSKTTTDEASATPEFTVDQIEAGIVLALRRGDFSVIPSLVTLIAVQDPARAQLVLDALRGRITLTLTAEAAVDAEEASRPSRPNPTDPTGAAA